MAVGMVRSRVAPPAPQHPNTPNTPNIANIANTPTATTAATAPLAAFGPRPRNRPGRSTLADLNSGTMDKVRQDLLNPVCPLGMLLVDRG